MVSERREWRFSIVNFLLLRIYGADSKLDRIEEDDAISDFLISMLVLMINVVIFFGICFDWRMGDLLLLGFQEIEDRRR